ncbi:ATP-binding cassette domain-containing protein [Streptomyces somaliensis DSM 40738]|uniref:ATP-binding cassette domain-containing protein n=1 Tax=Streptomyces somaliensis (strain ATCC 33201 / DSM 40738 / JCM 12659 / KCTC 9044 / NCTC 11332 / NRRL B-12077 / IP 733) TaxID=1134445 RepID=A0AA44DA69_STRE0|nr:ATP-binding cassette domain-containing protein [Streptomyces somaliensis DSM 40738]
MVALDGVHVDFRSGTTALLGPNGAGKTTLLSLLSTARRPHEGTVSLLGEPVGGRVRVRRVRERIGVLPQSFGYYPRFTVREFVEYAAWLRRVPGGRRRERTREALRLVELEKHADRRMGELSGGMLRRAGIAQAVVNEPALVLLDEPTVGLDPAQRVGFRRLIKDLGERSAVVMSTHLAEDVAHVCDRVHVLLDGRVRFTGSIRDLCARAPGRTGGTAEVDGPAVEAGYLAVVERSGSGAAP